MSLIRTTILAALIAGGAAQAQTAPAQAPKPAQPAKPAVAAKPAARSAERVPTEDEQLAIAALEGLMAQPAERALPILRKVLAGPQSTLVKQRALFVLGQIDGAEARDILLQTARSPSDLQAEAVRSIGIAGDKQSLDALQEIYKTASRDVKSGILQAWLIADRNDLVYQVAVSAKSEDERSEAIRLLGAMGATEELRKLGDQPNASNGLLDAYAIAGDLAGLRKIAEGTGEKSVRVDATRRIGIVDTDAARTALHEIYARSTDAEIRDAALQGMMIADDDEGVLALYRAAKSPEEKRSLLRMLSTMDSDAALQAIDATLEKKP